MRRRSTQHTNPQINNTRHTVDKKTNPCRSWLQRSSSSRRCYPAAMSASSNTREPSDPQAPTPQMSSHTKYRRPTSLVRCFMENVSQANMPCDNWQSESYAHLERYECHRDMETHLHLTPTKCEPYDLVAWTSLCEPERFSFCRAAMSGVTLGRCRI
jgi:hypothetical protein